MAAQSALRVGAGLVRLGAPRGIINSLEAKLLEVVKIYNPIPGDEEEAYKEALSREYAAFYEKQEVLA